MIAVYSKPNCPQCTLVKNYLENMEVPFEERDLSDKVNGSKYQQECLDMGYMQLPVIVKEFAKDAPHGQIRQSMTGFNPDALNKLLNSFE
jgi:glutaredoxin-like protein NrdH